jgi:group I intron endonuclease
VIVYKTTNLITGKFYIGKDKYNNPNYLGSGIKLKDAIKRYGLNNFKKEILEYCKSYNDLNERERFWIEYYQSTNPILGYNISTGGDGGDTFTNHPNKEQYRNKLRVASSIVNKKLKEKRKADAINLWQNESYRLKVMDGINKRYKDPEYIQRLKQSIKSAHNKPEVRKKKSEVQKGSKNSRWLGRIIVTNTEGHIIGEYETAVDASNHLKIPAHTIRQKCRSGEPYKSLKIDKSLFGVLFSFDKS